VFPIFTPEMDSGGQGSVWFVKIFSILISYYHFIFDNTTFFSFCSVHSIFCFQIVVFELKTKSCLKISKQIGSLS